MDFDFWLTNYKPIQNPLVELYQHWFDTSGEQAKYAKQYEKEKGINYIWTDVETASGDNLIVKGWHSKNHTAYYITEIPWNNSTPDVLVYEHEGVEDYLDDDETIVDDGE